jgi:hypothetical protein
MMCICCEGGSGGGEEVKRKRNIAEDEPIYPLHAVQDTVILWIGWQRLHEMKTNVPVHVSMVNYNHIFQIQRVEIIEMMWLHQISACKH